eukprot:108710-Chlamydomonas_euryale.AAC.2
MHDSASGGDDEEDDDDDDDDDDDSDDVWCVSREHSLVRQAQPLNSPAVPATPWPYSLTSIASRNTSDLLPSCR